MTHSSTSMRTGGRSREHVCMFVSVHVLEHVFLCVECYIKHNVVLKHIMYRNRQDLFPSGRVGSEDKTTGLSWF